MVKTNNGKVFIYFPQSKADDKLLERMIALAKRMERSVNWIGVKAIEEYLNAHEEE